MNETEFQSRRPRDECGIFAVYGHEDAAKLTYFGLYALQHRGQESAGIVASDGKQVVEHKAMGLVPEIFNERILNGLKGNNRHFEENGFKMAAYHGQDVSRPL